MTISSEEKYLSFVSQELLDAVNRIPDPVAELAERELKSLVSPTPTDYALKTSLWRELYKCEATGGIVTPRDIYGGIATSSYFKNHCINNQYRLAWLFRPTQIYEKEVEALLARGTERLWELVEMNIYHDDGEVDTKRGYLVLDTIKMIEQRAKGLAVQRVQSVNVNIEQNNKQKLQISATDDVDKRIKELEAELKMLPPKEPETINVRESKERIFEVVGIEETPK